MIKENKNWIKIIMAVATPLIALAIYLIKHNMALADVTVATTFWSDEASYYKQVAAMVEYGHPLGYFGFNESTAAVGGFGAWPPILFLHYAIIGKIFGWSYITPIVANFILWILALVATVLILKPSFRQTTFICLSWIAYESIIRFSLSAMAETIVTILMWLFTVFLIRYARSDKHVDRWFILANILMVILTIMRGFYAILGVIIIYYCIKKKCKPIVPAIEAVIMLVSAYLMLVLKNLLTAQYMESNLGFEATGSIGHIIHAMLGKIYHNFLESFGWGLKALHFDSMRGSWYIVLFIEVVWLIYKLIKTKKMDYFFMGFILCGSTAALWLLYLAQEGSRNMMAISIAGILVINCLEDKKWINIAILPVLVLLTWCSQDIFFESMESDKAEAMAYIEEGNATLSEIIDLDPENDPWYNTIAYCLSMDVRDMMPFPTGVGINWVYEDYIEENYDNMKSKYVAFEPGSYLEEYAKKGGWELVAEYGHTLVYQTR